MYNVISDLPILPARTSSVSLYVQIQDQIKLAIAKGRLVPGQRLPTVRDAARQLGVHVNTVSRAYAGLVQQRVLVSQRSAGTSVAETPSDMRLKEERQERLGAIITRALVETASLGFSPEETEAAFTLRLARWRTELLPSAQHATAAAKHRRSLVMMGSDDLALNLLASHLRRFSRVPMTSTHVGSLGGLIALAKGEAHIAGCHLLDVESGEYNTPFVKRVLPGVRCVVVTMVGRVQGLLVQRGNPKGIHSLEDLARADLRIINRQQGSGTRVLLDYLLRKVAVDPRRLRGYETEVDTHTAVAAAIASDQADVGLGILAAARVFGLDFIPLHNERYDLVIPQTHWDWQPVVALRRVLGSEEFKGSVRELGGYDTSETGSVVAELD